MPGATGYKMETIGIAMTIDKAVSSYLVEVKLPMFARSGAGSQKIDSIDFSSRHGVFL
jgi:hypothetical protein